MVKEELIQRSPLRILEKSIHGGVGQGNIGVITSKRGVGKTACLVHIAIDKLFQNKPVIHLSFASKTDHIIDWYEILFQEIAEKRKLEGVQAVHDSLVRNRVIMNFNQAGVTIVQAINSITALINDGHFNAEVIVIDGYKFSSTDTSTLSTLKALRAFAREHSITIWATADTDGTFNEKGVPTSLLPFMEEIAVLINLHNHDNHMELALIKDHDRYIVEDNMHLRLEPRTMLISE